MTPQKVLCLSRGASVAALAEQLRAHGWLALPADDLGEAQRILSRERVQVGLLCLWECAPLELDRVEACLETSTMRLTSRAILPTERVHPWAAVTRPAQSRMRPSKQTEMQEDQ